MQPRYYRKNRRKYNLKAHIVLVTKYRKSLLTGETESFIKKEFARLADKHDWNIVAMETDGDHIHLLLEYDAVERICDIIGTLKQESTYSLWMQHGVQLSRHYWKKQIFWSDGYFVCSIGEVSSTTIQRYIESQG